MWIAQMAALKADKAKLIEQHRVEKQGLDAMVIELKAGSERSLAEQAAAQSNAVQTFKRQMNALTGTIQLARTDLQSIQSCHDDYAAASNAGSAEVQRQLARVAELEKAVECQRIQFEEVGLGFSRRRVSASGTDGFCDRLCGLEALKC